MTMALRECTFEQAEAALARAGWPAPEYQFGKRYTVVTYKKCGQVVAERHDSVQRGKVVGRVWWAEVTP